MADSVSVGVLEKAFSRTLVDEVIEACGRREQRVRALPARVMAYFCLGLALWSDGSYEDVLGMVSSGLVWAVLERASAGWNGVTATPVTAAYLTRLRADLYDPPSPDLTAMPLT